MYVIDASLELGRGYHRPQERASLEVDGWCFLPENRRWDALERELLSDAIGLSALTTDPLWIEPDGWWKRCAAAYLRSRDPVQAAADAHAASRINFGSREPVPKRPAVPSY